MGTMRWASVFVTLLMVACGGDDGSGAPACISGMVVGCSCDDGSSGTQTCGASGAFEACTCSRVDPLSGDEAANAPGDPGAAASATQDDGAGSAESSSNGTADSNADEGPEAGEPSGTAGTSGGSGEAGSGSDDGAAGNDGGGAGSDGGGAGSDGGGAGNDGGGAGSDGGGAGSGGDNGGDEDPHIPEPGALFAPCELDSECKGDLAVCVRGGDPLQLEQPPVGYCSVTCLGTGGGGDECPQPETGTVSAICEPLSLRCVLARCAELECPVGMECVRRQSVRPPGMFVTIAECLYPARD